MQKETFGSITRYWLSADTHVDTDTLLGSVRVAVGILAPPRSARRRARTPEPLELVRVAATELGRTQVHLLRGVAHHLRWEGTDIWVSAAGEVHFEPVELGDWSPADVSIVGPSVVVRLHFANDSWVDVRPDVSCTLPRCVGQRLAADTIAQERAKAAALAAEADIRNWLAPNPYRDEGDER